MKITAHTTFPQLESAQRQAHEAAVLRAVAQVEAARELLVAATERGHQTDFWREALEHAEAEETRARRAFTNWQRRDVNAARRAFNFARALCAKTEQHFNELEKADEPKQTPHQAPRRAAQVA